MSDRIQSVQIDRIVLMNLELAPHRVEQLRAALESELQRLLEVESVAGNFSSDEIRRAQASVVTPLETGSETELARQVARGIARALCDME